MDHHHPVAQGDQIQGRNLASTHIVEIACHLPKTHNHVDRLLHQLHPMIIQPYIPMLVPPTSVTVKFLRKQNALLENLETEINIGRHYEATFDDRGYNPERRNNRLAGLSPYPE